MLIRVLLLNPQSAATTDTYLDEAELNMIQDTHIPDGPGTHRAVREKHVTALGLRNGMFFFTEESFDSVMARILEARGRSDEAARHAEAAKNKNSSLVV